MGAPDLERLGRELSARTDEVVERMMRSSAESAKTLAKVVEESFEDVGTVSTVAVARWMAGEGEAVAREVGQESWKIFARLASQREAALNEVTKRCLRWRDATLEVLDESAADLDLSGETLATARAMVQRSLDVTLVRMCQSFEDERQRAQDELMSREKELVFLATHDALTGLPNRTLILDRIEQTLTRTRLKQEPVAALFVDLDNFKAINDSLGHACGDELLCAVAERLEGVIRETDALGRLGGDEFVVVADGLSLAAGPELIAERLLEAFSEPFALGESRVPVKASIGIASGDRACAEDLLRDADIAMYRSKWSGKSRYLVFESGMEDEVQSRLETEMDLQGALDAGEFFLVYQPTFDLKAMTPTGVEALIRWRRPGRGVVEPDEFIPLLEESKLIVDVGAWVLKEACFQAAGWQREERPLELSVNVSALQLDTDDLIDDVKDALELSGLAPEALTIEITETALMTDAEETARRLRELKALGIRIAVDDFGTGYSSLSHLRQFPVDVLKIDRSFVSQLAEGGEGEILLHTLVQLGKALEIETTAEGIERPQDLSLIRDKNCDNGQGFLFTRPLSAQDAESFFNQWSPTRRFEVRNERPGDDRVPADGPLGPDAAAPWTDPR
ncbi:MAG TPA: EAL domain-containing protein [Solirubrobacterales bacterium]|jgi:diguanylate cyclase (GGDEF)-like protein|nr:EAL domain-containing protein [Solirubrobacterales bacterium]